MAMSPETANARNAPYKLKNGDEITPDGLYGWIGALCQKCNGSGEFGVEGRSCSECAGTGEHWGKYPVQPNAILEETNGKA